MEEKKQIIKKKDKKLKIGKIDVAIFLIVFTIFSIALLSFFPGILTSDGVDQINQARTNEYHSAHPILHTFVSGNLARMGGIWVTALFQILLFATIWTYSCKLLRKYNDTTKTVVFQIILTIIISIMPLNFMYAITLWKDIIYSYAFLVLLALIYVGIKEDYKYTLAQMVIYAISCVTIMKFRHNGMPIGFLMFIIILALNIFKVRKSREALKFIATFITIFVIMSIPEKAVNNIAKTSGASGALTSAKVYCMGNLLNTDIELQQDEIDFLNTIMDVDLWKESYSPKTGSPILFSKEYNKKVLENKENNKKFDEIFMKYAKQKPKIVIEHFLNINSIWWSIPEKYGMHSIVLSNSWISNICNGEYDNHPIWQFGSEQVNNYIEETMKTEARYEFNYRPAVAILIAGICIIIICIKEKKAIYLLILLPMMLNIGTYVFLISSHDHRYFYPCYMTAYISILMLITIKRKKINKRTKTNNPNNQTPKTLIIIPAYNEEESIEKVVNSIYEQNIENCDVLVINDGSKDNTLEKAQKTKAKVIDMPNNLGIGGAVQTGYLYAKQYNYDIAIQLDADGQHDPKYINKLIQEVKNGSDLVIGSRFIEKTKYEQTFFRMFGIKIISSIIKSMTGEKIYDTTSGYRAANKEVIGEFANSYPYDYPEPCTNMSIIKKGYTIKEISVEMKKRETGTSSISPFKSALYMFKVILAIFLMGIKD